jgi:hypothetical protein
MDRKTATDLLEEFNNKANQINKRSPKSFDVDSWKAAKKGIDEGEAVYASKQQEKK